VSDAGRAGIAGVVDDAIEVADAGFAADVPIAGAAEPGGVMVAMTSVSI
jgi:hypothetical protein